jgi:hypothetical protein
VSTSNPNLTYDDGFVPALGVGYDIFRESFKQLNLLSDEALVF